MINAPVPEIDDKEYLLMREYIETYCGIHIGEEKNYLIQTRLTTLMVETGCKNFYELHSKAILDTVGLIREKIIDAMTTNETLWFRDTAPYELLREIFFSTYCKELKETTRKKIRIWSAACSTGQEPYSIVITALEHARLHTGCRIPGALEIAATDISPGALMMARLGRYDSIAISRGMPLEVRDRYFTQQGKIWELTEEVKKKVTFSKFNLQNSLAAMGKFDLVFCRNVLIYFSDEFKRDLLKRIAQVLRPGGYLLLGASESLINYSSEFEMLHHGRALYYRVK